MRAKLRSVFVAALTVMVATLPVATNADDDTWDSTPFDANEEYVRVADKIFVYDKSQYRQYKGPDVTHWKLGDFIDERKRLGLILLAPSQWIYVDVMHDPMHAYYEFRDVKTGNLVFEMRIYDGLEGGIIIQWARLNVQI